MVELEQNVRYQHQTWMQERRKRGRTFVFLRSYRTPHFDPESLPLKTLSLNYKGLDACLTL